MGDLYSSLSTNTARHRPRPLCRNGSGRQAIMAKSPARAVKSLLQDACAERTDFPRKWTHPKVEDVCGLVKFRASIVPKRFTGGNVAPWRLLSQTPSTFSETVWNPHDAKTASKTRAVRCDRKLFWKPKTISETALNLKLSLNLARAVARCAGCALARAVARVCALAPPSGSCRAWQAPPPVLCLCPVSPLPARVLAPARALACAPFACSHRPAPRLAQFNLTILYHSLYTFYSIITCPRM